MVIAGVVVLSKGNSDKKQPTQKTTEVVKSLTLGEQRILLQKVLENVTVGDSNKVLVKGYIPLESEAQNESKSRESKHTNPHLELAPYLQWYWGSNLASNY